MPDPTRDETAAARFQQLSDDLRRCAVERDELRAEVERLKRVVSYQRARIPAED